jgi:protein subunit release factor B
MVTLTDVKSELDIMMEVKELPARAKTEVDRHFDLVSGLRHANGRIAELEASLRELRELVLEMTTSQNQWASQAAEQARRMREKARPARQATVTQTVMEG